MTSSADVFASATAMLAALQAGETTSRELLEACLDQIDRHAWINAVVTVDGDRARAEALTADRALAEGRRFGPLHGLPITVKHDVEVAGMLSTYGSPSRKDHVPR